MEYFTDDEVFRMLSQSSGKSEYEYLYTSPLKWMEDRPTQGKLLKQRMFCSVFPRLNNEHTAL